MARNLSNLRKAADGKILERKDLVHANHPGTVREQAERAARKWEVALDDWTPTGEPVVAFVNAGRWCGRCECGGAEYLNVHEPVFWCCSCFNIANDHRPRPVEFPDEDTRDRVAAVLLHRQGPVLPGGPSPRNWHPHHETVEDLVRQNLERGDPVPGD